MGKTQRAALSSNSSGDIYGTTKFGARCGTVFKLTGSLLATLYTFSCGNDGGKPDSGVVLDNNGNLFGTTGLYGPHGDANGGGVVYEISNSGTFSILYSFCSSANCSDGSSPDAGVVMASENVIWGTTAYGGNKTCNCGTVFKLTKSGSSWNETVVHRFIGGTHDGANPFTAPTISVQTVGGKKQFVIFGVTETEAERTWAQCLRCSNQTMATLFASCTVSTARTATLLLPGDVFQRKSIRDDLSRRRVRE
jgi:uncharacterized repeat protein (TIGR03803 family)